VTRAQDPDAPRANPLEILGAWLHVWTPPRDVEIPPVPRRGAAILAACLLVAVALVLVVVRPAVDSGKRADAQRRAEEHRASLAQRQAIARRDQKPVTGAAAGLAPATSPAERDALLSRVERAITVNANARQAAGTLTSRTRSTSCEPLAELSETRSAFDCTALIREIIGQGDPGRLGYPFRAIVDFRSASWTFCKINPIPSEQSLPDPRTVVPLPAACRLPSR
jgi:hypothetical protein